MDEQTVDADKTLADRVIDHLTQAILSGELQPGTRISEPKLAKQLGVSRGPLREATRRLQERMLLTHTPRQGVRVVELSREVLHEVCTIREALEGVAAREAAMNITDEEAIELTEVIERHRRLLESTDTEACHKRTLIPFKRAKVTGNRLKARILRAITSAG